jgi:hypothetical protein
MKNNKNESIIQMDGVTRENSRVGIDEKVKIQKVSHKPEARRTLSPLMLSGFYTCNKGVHKSEAGR